MRRSKRGIALGAALCVLTLVVSVLLQKAGYLIYLNSDMASEIILANRQAQTHSLVQMDWLYSTEIHSVHMNLFYALAFVFTPSYEAARIIGNTLVFVMGMAACAGLCSACGLSLGASLCAAAMLPLAASTVYAENMTVGGYYIIHLVFGFWGAALWLKAARQRRKRNTAAFAAICLVEGLCSVRYVLCFLCPMVVVAGLDWLLASGRRTLRDTHTRFLGVTLAGFALGVLGYAASEVVYPRLFVSGVRLSAFTSADMPEMMQQALGGLARLMGYSEGSVLLSIHGLASVGALLLPAAAAILMGRALKAARRDGNNVLRVGVLTLAMSAAITALSFVLLEDLYLNRYWIPLMTLGAPMMAACLSRENNAPLRNVCVLLFAGVVVVSSAMQIAGSMKNPEITSVQRERAAHLQNNGLTFGYATFWNANVVTELTDGDVEAVAVSIDANAQGQGVPHTSMWLEATADRRMERPDEPVFLMLTAQESGQLSDFLALSGAQKRWEQSGMTIYEIESQRVFFETAQTMDAQ